MFHGISGMEAYEVYQEARAARQIFCARCLPSRSGNALFARQMPPEFRSGTISDAAGSW
jgi:hypothetical protein